MLWNLDKRGKEEEVNRHTGWTVAKMSHREGAGEKMEQWRGGMGGVGGGVAS